MITKGTHGFEPWTYRTAADCSTTELYPLLLIIVGCTSIISQKTFLHFKMIIMRTHGFEKWT